MIVLACVRLIWCVCVWFDVRTIGLVCLACVCRVFGVCLLFVCRVFAVCLACVCCLFGVCLACVCRLFGVCLACVWRVFAMCLACVWRVFVVCLPCVWRVFVTGNPFPVLSRISEIIYFFGPRPYTVVTRVVRVLLWVYHSSASSPDGWASVWVYRQ